MYLYLIVYTQDKSQYNVTKSFASDDAAITFAATLAQDARVYRYAPYPKCIY